MSSTTKHLKLQLSRIPDAESDSTFIHLIVAAPWTSTRSGTSDFDHIHSTFEDSLKLIPKCKTVITTLQSDRIECIQKEKYEQYLKGSVKIQVDKNKTVKAKKSVGDDIEDFLEEMKFEKRKSQITLLQSVQTFHLSMLSDGEENKMKPTDPSVGTLRDLTIGNDGLRNVLPPITWKYKNFKNRTKLSKNEQNYALSVCYRSTDFNAHVPKPNFRDVVHTMPLILISDETTDENIDEITDVTTGENVDVTTDENIDEIFVETTDETTVIVEINLALVAVITVLILYIRRLKRQLA